MITDIAYRARDGVATLLGRREMTVTDRNERHLLLSGAWFGPIDGGIYNYLPVFLARLGAPASIISLLTSGPALLGTLAFIPGGALAEREPDQMKFFVRVAMIGRLSYLLIALLPLFFTGSALPLAIVVVWSLASIPTSLAMPAWTAGMQKAVPPDRRAKLNGMRWSLMSLLSGTSILIYGLWLDNGPFPAAYQIVFLISFIAALFNLYYFYRVKIPPFVPAARDGATRANWFVRLNGFLRPLAESPAFVRYNVAGLTYRLALAMPVGLYSVYWVNDLKATDTWIGLRGTAGYAALVVGYWFWGRTANRLGDRTLLLICGSALAFYPIMTATAPSVPWLLPAAVLWGFTASGVDIGLFDMLLAVCPEGKQPRFAAAANTLSSVTMTVGPLLGAAVAGILGTRGALYVVGCLQLLGALAFLLLPGKEQR